MQLLQLHEIIVHEMRFFFVTSFNYKMFSFTILNYEMM